MGKGGRDKEHGSCARARARAAYQRRISGVQAHHTRTVTCPSTFGLPRGGLRVHQPGARARGGGGGGRRAPEALRDGSGPAQLS